MSVDITARTTITCPPETVWAIWADPLRDVEWTSGLLEAKLLTEGPLAAGTRIERTSKFLGRRFSYTIDITGVEAGHAIDMVTSAGPFPMTVRYQVEATPEGCAASIRTTGEPKGFFKLTGGLMSGQVKKQVQLDLDTLKALIEGGAA